MTISGITLNSKVISGLFPLSLAGIGSGGNPYKFNSTNSVLVTPFLCENPLMNKQLTFAHKVAEGIYCIDTGFGRDQFDASYLVVSDSQAAFIDVGTNYSAPRLLKTLSELSLAPHDVRYVILTHVHLDHAGGAGEVMRLCPKAQLIVHPRGARHMIDPSALRAGAVGVYGEDAVQKDYGQLLPIDASRVTEAGEGFEIILGQRQLVCMDTPGHAKHHIAIWDPLSQGVFTGDTFGLSYREFDTEQGAYIMPTTTPIQFDPLALKESVERICALNPACIYPTHYSRVDNVPRLKTIFLKQLDEMVQMAVSFKSSANRYAKIKSGLADIYENHLKTNGCNISRGELEAFLAIDLDLNTQGIEVWLDKA